jgi:hypothetical protein
MEEYISNSHKSKENVEEKSLEKKVDAVISSPAKTKKKTGLRKLADVFLAEDRENVKSYIFMDVIVPSIRNGIRDVVTNGIDMLLYGSAGKSKKNATSKVSYRSYYEQNDREKRIVPSTKEGFDYDDIIFASRGDAESVLSALEDIIEQYGVASVGDLYDLADISTGNYMINKYGWTNLRSAQVVRGRDGYLLKLPKALPIN